jgi:hypothetical protein
MDWSGVPILTAAVAGFIGVSLMAAAFVMVAHKGGWKPAMQAGPDGRWSLPRRLMFAGALLGFVFAFVVNLLFAIPGGIPWSDGPDWTGIAVMLPALAALWYHIIRPAHTSQHHDTRGGQQ